MAGTGGGDLAANGADGSDRELHATERTIAVVVEATVFTSAGAAEVHGRVRSSVDRGLRGLGRTTVDIVLLNDLPQLNAETLQEMKTIAQALVADGWTGAEVGVLRRARSMSVREFAKHIGVSDRMVSKWEQGERAIKPRPVNQEAMDTSLNRLNVPGLIRFIDGISDLRGGESDSASLAYLSDIATAIRAERTAMREQAVVHTEVPVGEIGDEIKRSLARLARIAGEHHGGASTLSRLIVDLLATLRAEEPVGLSGGKSTANIDAVGGIPRPRTEVVVQKRAKPHEVAGRVAEVVATDAMLEALGACDIAAVYRILSSAGVSQRQIANLTGQSQSEISEILAGRKVKSVDVLVRIADGLGVNRAVLVASYRPER
jgi:transcriptional regulator with XRE-family HTH domain